LSVSVRRATEDDLEHLVACNSGLAAETEDTHLSRDTLLAGVRAALGDPNRGFYLVAKDDGARAGALLITKEWSDWRNAWFWWIQSVFVLPEFRKRGIYAALHNEVLSLARRSGDVCGIRLYVDHENERAKATYEKMGMRPGRYDFYEQDVD
jgi:GNAT superfamily N-acetyltransferase